MFILGDLLNFSLQIQRTALRKRKRRFRELNFWDRGVDFVLLVRFIVRVESFSGLQNSASGRPIQASAFLNEKLQ
jgi:hypothetical protein